MGLSKFIWLSMMAAASMSLLISLMLGSNMAQLDIADINSRFEQYMAKNPAARAQVQILTDMEKIDKDLGDVLFGSPELENTFVEMRNLTTHPISGTDDMGINPNTKAHWSEWGQSCSCVEKLFSACDTGAWSTRVRRLVNLSRSISQASTSPPNSLVCSASTMRRSTLSAVASHVALASSLRDQRFALSANAQLSTPSQLMPRLPATSLWWENRASTSLWERTSTISCRASPCPNGSRPTPTPLCQRICRSSLVRRWPGAISSPLKGKPLAETKTQLIKLINRLTSLSMPTTTAFIELGG